MTAGSLNLSIEQGTTFVNNMTVNVDGSTDITNFTFSGQIRSEKLSDHVLATFTITKTDNAAGTFTVSLTAAQTATLPTGTLVYDIKYENSGDSSTVRLLEGNVTVSGQVTRS